MTSEEKAKKLKGIAAEIGSKVSTIHGVRGALEIAPFVITAIEEMYSELDGADKKELAVAVINSIIDVPFVPESVEAMAIEAGVDATISFLNAKFGHSWIDKIKVGESYIKRFFNMIKCWFGK